MNLRKMTFSSNLNPNAFSIFRPHIWTKTILLTSLKLTIWLLTHIVKSPRQLLIVFIRIPSRVEIKQIRRQPPLITWVVWTIQADYPKCRAYQRHEVEVSENGKSKITFSAGFAKPPNLENARVNFAVNSQFIQTHIGTFNQCLTQQKPMRDCRIRKVPIVNQKTLSSSVKNVRRST